MTALSPVIIQTCRNSGMKRIILSDGNIYATSDQEQGRFGEHAAINVDCQLVKGKNLIPVGIVFVTRPYTLIDLVVPPSKKVTVEDLRQDEEE